MTRECFPRRIREKSLRLTPSETTTSKLRHAYDRTNLKTVEHSRDLLVIDCDSAVFNGKMSRRKRRISLNRLEMR